MPEGDGIDVSPQALHKHADDMRTFMGYMESASDSAGDTFNVEAFGVIGMSWSWILRNWTQDAKTFVQQATEAGHHVADQVSGMANAYTEQDTAGQKQFEDIHKSTEEK